MKFIQSLAILIYVTFSLLLAGCEYSQYNSAVFGFGPQPGDAKHPTVFADAPAPQQPVIVQAPASKKSDEVAIIQPEPITPE